MIEHPYYVGVCKDAKQLSAACLTIQMGADENGWFPIEIIAQRKKKRRSDQANRYLWGVVYAIISQETGNDVNDLHSYFCGEFFGWEEYEVMGRKRVRAREGSSKQIKARFSEFLEFIISRAAGLGIVVPPPNHDLPESLLSPESK